MLSTNRTNAEPKSNSLNMLEYGSRMIQSKCFLNCQRTLSSIAVKHFYTAPAGRARMQCNRRLLMYQGALSSTHSPSLPVVAGSSTSTCRTSLGIAVPKLDFSHSTACPLMTNIYILYSQKRRCRDQAYSRQNIFILFFFFRISSFKLTPSI